MRPAIDPITLEIIANGLRSVADESYIALMKSAYSTNIKERHDHSTAIIDPAGRLIVQAENSLAIHLGSMMGLMETLIAKVPRSRCQTPASFRAFPGASFWEVRLILLVLAANKLQNVGIRNQPQIQLQGKRPSVVFRVIEGHIQLHVPEVAAVVALRNAHGLAPRIAGTIKPAFIGKPNRFDGQRVTLPLTQYPIHDGCGSLGIVRPSV